MATRGREKSHQTMLELMAAAEELFGRQGFAATTVAEITRHAGYAKGSFYRHWPGKDQLFLAIVERKLKAYRAARDERIGQAQGLADALNVIWDFLEGIAVDRQWAKVFLEFTVHAARDTGLRQELRKSQNRLSEQVFADLLRPFVGEGFPLEKIGALNTVLFEGFLVHNALEINLLRLADVREAAVTLALAGIRSGGDEMGEA